MSSKLFILLLILPFVKLELKNFPHNQNLESKSSYWNNLAKEEIEKVKNQEPNIQKAKNVIIFLGDGMGISTLTAGRILEGQLNGKSGEEGSLFFEKFPNSALMKTYNIDRLVPDSAGTATAYLTGVKSNYLVLGVNAAINSEETNCKKIKENSVDSIMEMARKSGKAIGVVTTTRITHATPGASYCHVANRDWENDAVMPKETQKAGCKDIARQLIEDQPGHSFNVIFGGGRKNFLPTSLNGSRTDNLNLIDAWKKNKKEQNLKENEYKYVDNYHDLNNLNTDELKYVFGLFNQDHLSYNATLLPNRTEPTLNEMTQAAVKVLSKFENGFVLLVEGGLIDIAHHHNQAVLSLHELVHFDHTIKNAYKLINPKETLVLVTADHSHPFTVNGYPARGTNIFGFSDEKEFDENMNEGSKKFTILLYGNGPGHTSDIRPDPEKQKTDDNNYLSYSAVRTDYTTHGGEDVAVYSQGPWSHLFKTLHEQNYIAHVMAYASCIGDYTNESHCQNNSFLTSGYTIAISASIIIIIAFITFGVYICKKNQYF